jgi:hypothetical protein
MTAPTPIRSQVRGAVVILAVVLIIVLWRLWPLL